jgi:hypothetical protein
MGKSDRMPIRCAFVLIATAALSGCAETGSAHTPTSPPATEQPLLGPPDPAGPTQRGVFLKDPKGQVQRIAAGGHLVAWSVRAPAAKRHDDDYGRPQVLPKSSKVVIADERGGAVLTVDLGRRWVSALRMLRGVGGPAEPQLAVRACRTRKLSSCQDELLTLPAEPPLKILRRSGATEATAAIKGHLDSGRWLRSSNRSCTAQLTVRDAGGTVRTLPALPARDKEYTRCNSLDGRRIYGRYAFAGVLRTDPKLNFEAEFLYGIDVTAGSSARWAEIARPYTGTDGGSTIPLGPVFTDNALFWEPYDTVEESVYSLQRVVLSQDIQQPQSTDTANTSDPIVPDASDACDIAASDNALYELSNPYCALGYSDGHSEIRRLVNPEFRSQSD